MATRPFGARPPQLGRRPHCGWAVAPLALHDLPLGGSPDRLKASPQPDRLDLAGHRPLVDARLLRRLRCGKARLAPLPGGDGRLKQLALGFLSGAAGHFLGPSVPRGETSFKEVPSSWVALWGCDRVSERRRHMLAPGPLQGLGRLRNPFGLEGYPWVTPAPYIVLLLLPLCILASALSLLLRYRRSRSEYRESR